MPYKDPKRKAEWERANRQQRLARRRELRRFEASQEATAHDEVGLGGFTLPLVAIGGGLAISNPWLGLGVGSMTLTAAALRKASWRWWIIGAVIVLLSLWLLWNRPDQNTTETVDRSNET